MFIQGDSYALIAPIGFHLLLKCYCGICFFLIADCKFITRCCNQSYIWAGYHKDFEPGEAHQTEP